MSLARSILAFGALALTIGAAPVFAQHKHGHSGQHGPRFDDPEKWAKAFDDPQRAAWQKPDEVIAALGLKPDATVADIGAGTGYFAIRLARTVKQGAVYAVDLEPRMVAHMAERAKSLGLGNLRAIEGTAASPNLPERVDQVLLVNVYHHIDDRVAYFKKLASSLKPGGRIAIVDQNETTERGPPKSMRVAVETIDTEMKQAGFARLHSYDFLPHQNFLVFQAAQR